MRKYLLIGLVSLVSCKQKSSFTPVIGFVDAFQDSTIELARDGFTDALKGNGFDEKDGHVKIIYRNAQGNIPAITQIIKYFINEQVSLIAANTTLATITAVQNTKTIPIFMMVAPTPALMKVNGVNGEAPRNLYGVGETLDYIDTSFLMIPRLIRSKTNPLRVGMIFNQSEPQSNEAIQRIEALAGKNNISITALPVNNSADVQLITAALLSKNIDAFFANPDNTVFASFESIVKACKQARVPIFTSEAGLVARGALAAYGADIYQWGYQAGQQASNFLKTKDTSSIHWEMVKIRKKVYNPEVAKYYNITMPANFESINRK
jgi:putative tryptophan/tyrosine transport system substrate-binding protein